MPKRGSKGGIREDLGFYVRSTWEANYARYLIWLKANGEILDWEYEPDEFVFPLKRKRGNFFYTPDFKVTELDSTIAYHEVKGYMDRDSRIKLTRMKKHYPDVKIVLIDKPAYYAIAKWKHLISPHWE